MKRITDDDRLSGTRNSSGEWVVVLANADDVTVITKNQNELDIINEHFQLYEDVKSGRLHLCLLSAQNIMYRLLCYHILPSAAALYSSAGRKPPVCREQSVDFLLLCGRLTLFNLKEDELYS